MKHLAPIILFTVACHYVFVAALSSHVAGWRAGALILAVLCGALFVFVAMIDSDSEGER